MNLPLFEKLFAENLISDQAVNKARELDSKKLFSVHWELRTILYLGIVLLSTGLGILVYKNIDTIGHQVILLFIAIVCASSFYYCTKSKLPFSRERVPSPNSFTDYILLLGCLSLVTFVGYIQFQYNIFGERYGLALFIPMVLLFIAAYCYDHLGVLSMAITNLAAWAGIAINPSQIIHSNNFSDSTIIYTGILLGISLTCIAIASRHKKIKAHFGFTYLNFGMHTLFIACLAAMFEFDYYYLLWFLALLAVAAFFYSEAFRSTSFYIILILSLYTYVALSYAIIKLIMSTNNLSEGSIYLGLIYFIASGIGLIRLLIHLNKKLKTHDSI